MGWKNSRKTFHTVEKTAEYFPWCGKTATIVSMEWKNGRGGEESRVPGREEGLSGFDKGNAGVFAVGAFGAAKGGMAAQEFTA